MDLKLWLKAFFVTLFEVIAISVVVIGVCMLFLGVIYLIELLFKNFFIIIVGIVIFGFSAYLFFDTVKDKYKIYLKEKD